MSNTAEDILRALRAQAWERAKAELRAVAVTFFGTASAAPRQFEEFDEAARAFIKDIEDRGLTE